VVATVEVLHLYAVFVNDTDGDTIRDELDNCPLTPNTGQLDTNDDGLGDACQCLNANCSDGNVCTTDSCTPAAGCLHTNNTVACDDGDPCTTADVCASGTCSGVTITAPPEALDLAADPDKVRLTWSEATYATSYDVVSGSIPSGGGVSLAAGACLSSVTDLLFDDLRAAPAPETGYWYLVRGHNSCGAGTYGTTERDTNIPSCP
jgi:hypothetical protein